MYLKGIALTRTYPCLAEPGKIIVDGRPTRSLAEVIPYLAALPGVITYNPDVPTLTFRRWPGFLTLYANRVTITQVQDAEEGLALLATLVEAVNATWAHRDELTAVSHVRRPPPAIRHLRLVAANQLQTVWRSDLHGFCLWSHPAKPYHYRMSHIDPRSSLCGSA